MLNYQDVLNEKRLRLFGASRVPGEHLRGVEFGPLSRPLVSKETSEIYYIDHCSTEELKKKYAGDANAHVDDIVGVDFVRGDEPLAQLIGDKAPLDYIVASHVIEHVPDLAGWLLDMHASLKDGGTLYLIVPDKRFTFDAHRRPASFQEVEAAYLERRSKPGLRLILDHFANVVDVDTWALWDDYSMVDKAPFTHGPEFLDLAHKHFHEGRYVDVHCWVFTPWSFLQLMGQITDRMGLGFRLAHFMTTQFHDLEFYVALQRSASRTNWAEQARLIEAEALRPSGPSER